MGDTEFLEKRDAWLKLRKQLEEAQEEIDLRMAAFFCEVRVKRHHADAWKSWMTCSHKCMKRGAKSIR